MFDCMDKLQLMQIFMHLDCVHLPPPERNKLVLNLLNESFWVKHQIKRTLVVMIHLLVLLILPEMFQLYPTKLPEHPSLVLYNFDNPVEITRFKAGVGYTQRSNRDFTEDGPDQSQPQAPDPEPSSPPLKRSTRTSKPPDHYGFSNVSFIDTLSSISICNSYSQAVS